MTTRFMECNPIVTVSDVSASKRFYIDVLGFSVDFDAGEVVGLLKDKVLILLISQDSENVRQLPGSSNISFLTDEVDLLYEKCIAARGGILARIIHE